MKKEKYIMSKFYNKIILRNEYNLYLIKNLLNGG